MRVCRWVVAAMLAVCGAMQAQVGEEPEKTAETAATQKPDAPVPLETPGLVRGEKLTQKLPHYPADARAAGLEGVVTVHLIITREGRIENPVAIEGPEVFRAAAVDAVKQWTYTPFLLNNEPVAVDAKVNVRFKIEESYPPKPNVIRIAAGVAEGIRKTSVAPVYPADAKAAHIDGQVVLYVRLDTNGVPQNVSAVSGPDMLRQAAIDAVTQWRYKPYLLNGEPISVDTTVIINFNLR